MKALFFGVGSVIFRQQSRFRRRAYPNYTVAPDWVPSIDPTDLCALWVMKNGDLRRYYYRGGWTSDQILDIAASLAGVRRTFGPIGGWLMNEQIAPRLYFVEKL